MDYWSRTSPFARLHRRSSRDDAQIKPRFVSTSHESLRRIAASAINAMQDMTAEDGVACGTASYIHRVPP